MNVDYIAKSIPFFFVFILAEIGWSLYKKLDYYRLNDSISNLSQGVGQQIVGIFMKTALFFGYSYIFQEARLFTMRMDIVTWVVLFLAVDFFYYWFHRMSHQVNALWAAHIVHHQSEEYNLTVALRQSWFQGWFSWVFYLPLAFLGFDPIMFLTISAFNTIYQFWIHTRAIKSLGPLEYILNTPSHHRVHHGSNPKYIDKNHAGTLIIWDKLFGTFQREEEEVWYGITKPLGSWNPVWANLHYWSDLIAVARKMPLWSDKVNVFLKSPGWLPDQSEPLERNEKQPEPIQKYDPKCMVRVSIYVFVQFGVALIAGSLILFKHQSMDIIGLLTGSLFVMFTLVTCGALLDGKNWTTYLEFPRLLVGIIVILFLKLPFIYAVAGIMIQIIFLSWYSILFKQRLSNAKIQAL